MVIETVPRDAEVARRTRLTDVQLAMQTGWIRMGQRVLDLGCGLSDHLEYLAQHGVRAYGVDDSAAALAAQRSSRPRERHPDEHEPHPKVDGERYRNGHASARVDRPGLLRADVLHLPFAPATFDVLLDRGCLQHLPPPARAAYVGELRRVLRPDGQVLLFRDASDPAYEDAAVQGAFGTWSVSVLDGGFGYALNPSQRPFG